MLARTLPHLMHATRSRKPATIFATMIVAAITFIARVGVAQTNATCKPPEDSNEAKLLAFFATPIAFSPGGIADGLSPWRFRVAFEATYVPSPGREMQQPEACYGVRKTENTDLSPVFPRPRVAVGLPGGLVLEASYLPPIEVADAEPNLGSVALSRPFTVRSSEDGSNLSLIIRAHGTLGRVRGSITCPEENIQQSNPGGACYGEEASEDTYEPNMFGGELALAREGAGERWGAYATGGVTLLRPRFQVGFQYLGGTFDDTKIEVDMTRLAVGAGAWYRVANAAAITGELYSVPTDATTFRIGGAYMFR
jgi:hypothetical protein